VQLRWRESKRCGLPMFPVETASELSDAQSLFLHWIELYDWVFSLPDEERPTPYVIEDDEKFDNWYNSYVARKKSKKGSKASSHANVINF
jgi:hypothetical protein